MLDGVVVSISIAEIISAWLFAAHSVQLSSLRLLRILRVARVLRLTRAWRGLYTVLATVMQALPQMRNVFLLLFLMTTIFALLGMEVRLSRESACSKLVQKARSSPFGTAARG